MMDTMRNGQRTLSAGVLALVLAVAGTSYADEVPNRPQPAAPQAAFAPLPEDKPKALPAEKVAPAAAAGQPDKDGFVSESRPMNGPTVDESIPAGPLLAAAYGFVWLAVLGYVLLTGRGLRKVETDLAELDAKISKLSKKS